MKFKSIALLVLGFSVTMVLTQACGGGGGGGGSLPNPTLSHLFYAECIDTACNDTALFEYAPELGTHTRVDSNIISYSGASHATSKSSIVVNGKLYFSGRLASRPNYELFVYDPFAAKEAGVNPKAVYEGTGGSDVAIANPTEFAVNGNLLYFSASSTSAVGSELYIFDTTQPGSATNPRVIDVNVGGTLASAPQYITFYNNKIYFKAFTASTGYEFWVYDPSQALSYLVNPKPLETVTGSGSGDVDFLQVHKGKLYFRCTFAVGGAGNELCVYDDSVAYGANGANPSLVADIETGANSSFPSSITTVGDKLVFAAMTAANGWELYTYDDGVAVSSSNPAMVELTSGVGSGFESSGFAVIGNQIFFNGDNGTDGNELFSYDVTQAVSSSNPRMIEMVSGVDGADPSSITKCLVDTVCFAANEPTSGNVYLVTLPAIQTSITFSSPFVKESIALGDGEFSAFTSLSWNP